MPIKLFLLTNIAISIWLGQSNMEGRESRVCACTTNAFGVSGVMWYNRATATWTNSIRPPIGAYSFGPEFQFMLLRGTNSAVIKIASNSTTIANWRPGGFMWNTATNVIATARAALTPLGYTGDVASIAWFQGESNATDSNAANAYQTAYTNAITDWRTALGTNCNWTAARILPSGGDGPTDIVRKALTNAVNLLPDVHWIDCDSLPVSYVFPPAHLSAEGQLMLGQLFHLALP